MGGISKNLLAARLTWLFTCAAWLVFAQPLAAQDDDEPVDDAISRILAAAERADERGQTRRAHAIRRRALARSDASDGRAPIALGRALPIHANEILAAPEGFADRARVAGDALRRFLDAAPVDALALEATRLRAWATALGGDHDAAIRVVTRASRLQDRAAADTLRLLAALAITRDDLVAARLALQAAHRAMPQDSDILSDLGIVQLALGAPANAVETFQRILGRRPTDLDTRRDLGGALVAAGRSTEAVRLLVAAIESHPAHLELHLELAYAAIEAGEIAIASRAANVVINNGLPTDGRGYAALGSARAAEGLHQEAEAAYREAVRRDPNDFRASQGLRSLQEAAAPPPSDPAGPAGRLGDPLKL